MWTKNATSLIASIFWKSNKTSIASEPNFNDSQRSLCCTFYNQQLLVSTNCLNQILLSKLNVPFCKPTKSFLNLHWFLFLHQAVQSCLTVKKHLPLLDNNISSQPYNSGELIWKHNSHVEKSYCLPSISHFTIIKNITTTHILLF